MRKYFNVALVLLITLIVGVVTLGCDSKNSSKIEGDYCLVTFCNWDGTILLKKKCLIGTGVYPPVDPIRPDDDQNSYVFSNWDVDLNNITQDTITTAQFTPIHIIRLTLMLDGEIYASWKLEDEAKQLEELPTPTAAGKEFDSWYISSRKLTIEVIQEFSAALETKDIVCYGEWK